MRSPPAIRRWCRARSARWRAARRRRLRRPPSTPRPLAGPRCSRWLSARRPWLGRFQPAAARPPAGTAAAQASALCAPSSRCLPGRAAVLVVLELDAHRLELVSDAVGLLETFRLARGITCIDERVHLICIDDAAMRMIFERFAFCDFEHSKKTSRRLQFVLELQLMQS